MRVLTYSIRVDDPKMPVTTSHIKVQIGNEIYEARHVEQDRVKRHVPIQYAVRALKRKLMNHIETTLFEGL